MPDTTAHTARTTPAHDRPADYDATDFGADAGNAGSAADWWRSAVFYQIYPRSFADGNNDGMGDLIGVTERLDYLKLLGVDALWLSPFYTSPMADGGYDVADPTDVDPMFGTLADFDALIAAAHERGIKVTVDIVPNHLSDQHVWFQQALAAGPGSPERERFIFADGRGENGDEPPNNWPSVFGGPAWTRVADGQWYLHIFAPEQPDVNWANPEIPAEFERVLRFWMERGADGFRVDVAHSMAKPHGLPDMDLTHYKGPNTQLDEDYRFDNDGVHEHLRMFRRVIDSYPNRMAVGEAWVPDDKRLALYVRGDELHLTFNFRLEQASYGAESFRDAIDQSLVAMSEVGAPCTWVLSNHDVDRHVTRYGGGEVGLARGQAAALVQLALPGAVYLYNGDELGLENVDLPDEVLQDPTWERSGHTERGRDGERVPLPWSGEQSPFGFSASAEPWLPMPAEWADKTVEAQLEDSESTLSLYRRALELRHELPALTSEDFTWLDAAEGCMAFQRDDIVVVFNGGDAPVELPAGEVLLASAPVDSGKLPANTTVWLRA